MPGYYLISILDQFLHLQRLQVKRKTVVRLTEADVSCIYNLLPVSLIYFPLSNGSAFSSILHLRSAIMTDDARSSSIGYASSLLLHGTEPFCLLMFAKGTVKVVRFVKKKPKKKTVIMCVLKLNHI